MPPSRSPVTGTVPERRDRFLTGTLLFASGFAGLVYQVLWMRELGLLFGNDAYAVATTLAAFFLGIALGSAVFGRRAHRYARPLLAYAGLEVGVAATALLYFGLLDLFHFFYGPLFAVLGGHRIGFTSMKFFCALVALLPPAFFMGGTLPLMSQHLVRRADTLGVTASTLYGLNTLGAALGAVAAAFVLVPTLGVRTTYGVALATSLGVAAVAAGFGRARSPGRLPAPEPGASAPRELRLLAAVSGFATLALEVLWTRMFAQVLQNSVYTFALILTTFLLALAAGAAGARVLATRSVDPRRVLVLLLVGGGLLVAATPYFFVWYTNGLAGVDVGSPVMGFSEYVWRVLGATVLILGLPTVWLGLLFPYLLKAAEVWRTSPGRVVGELAAINTLGGVAGALAAGFAVLEFIGLWHGIALVALLYLGTSLALSARTFDARLWAAVSVGAALVVVAVVGASGLPHAALPADREIVAVLEGPSGTVAVVEHPTSLDLWHNNSYGVGGTDDRDQEARQAHFPLVLHPAPRRVFFLGLGTGITAGAALQHPLERLWVTELLPEVSEASRRHFAPWLNGLFEDSRATILVEDGRNHLLGSRALYDVIIADLFLPWKSGTGSLYSREHYVAARERLAPGGVYAQWLALYQFSREEFAAVANTLVEVFPRVTLWRGNRRPTYHLALLVAERDPAPLDLESIGRRIEAISPVARDGIPREPDDPAIPPDAVHVLSSYQGNLTAARQLLSDAPINTDDRPFVEYSSPVTHRDLGIDGMVVIQNAELLDFYDAVFAAAPPETDPVLAEIPPAYRGLPRAGLELYRSRVMVALGHLNKAVAARGRHKRLRDAALEGKAAGGAE